MTPLVVVEGPAATVARVRRRLEREGYRVVEGWRRSARLVCAGTVATDAEAVEAVLAALAGAGLLVHATGERTLTDRLVDDLRRLGPVEHVTSDREPPATLTREELLLLEQLGEGRSLGDAASTLHLSRRTADRRLAAARGKLGVASTAEALVAARRLGLLG